MNSPGPHRALRFAPPGGLGDLRNCGARAERVADLFARASLQRMGDVTSTDPPFSGRDTPM